MSRPKTVGLLATFLAFAPSTAFAEKLCTIDFQRAVTDTAEGKAAQSKIDNMYATRKGELERMQSELQKAVEDYQKRAAILSNEARSAEEQKLALQQRTFEQTYMQFQDEMQQTYMSMLGDLDGKMRLIAVAVGKENTCSIVIDTAVVVYAGTDVLDVTGMLVTRYNTTHPPK
jgi:outer membrane protein